MTDFSFRFSYDPDGHVAWLALDGHLDGPAAKRLQHVLRTAIGGLEPRKLLVDARDLTHLDGASIYRLFRAGAATDRPDCDIVLVTCGVVRVLPRSAWEAVA
jgi:anti-anti-sigma regulatory factor